MRGTPILETIMQTLSNNSLRTQQIIPNRMSKNDDDPPQEARKDHRRKTLRRWCVKVLPASGRYFVASVDLSEAGPTPSREIVMQDLENYQDKELPR